MDGQDVTINVITVDPRAWTKPGTEQQWWTVTTKENSSEPTKFIQDKSKGVEPPKMGEYKGKMYGNKFYPANPNAPTGGFKGGGRADPAKLKQEQDKQDTIVAEWAIGKAIASLGLTNLDEVEAMAVNLQAMVYRVKAALRPKVEAVTETAAPVIKKASKSSVMVNEEESIEDDFASLARSLDQGVPIQMDRVPY